MTDFEKRAKEQFIIHWSKLYVWEDIDGVIHDHDIDKSDAECLFQAGANWARADAEAEIKRLREALAFYADAHESWNESDNEVPTYSIVDESDLSEETWVASWGDVKCMVGGKRARDALKGE